MKRVLETVPKVLKILLFIFTAVILVFTLLSSFGFNRDEGIFGFQMYIVLSDSMRGTFRVGDVAVSRKMSDPSALKEGDVITFRSVDPSNYGAVVTHKIRGRTEYFDSLSNELVPAFVTYGTATGVDDTVPALEKYVLGKYIFAIPKVGYIFSNLKTPLGYVLIVLAPFALLIGLEGANFLKLLKEYRSEVQKESDRRMQDLESENVRLREMMGKMEKEKEEGQSGGEKPENEEDGEREENGNDPENGP